MAQRKERQSVTFGSKNAKTYFFIAQSTSNYSIALPSSFWGNCTCRYCCAVIGQQLSLTKLNVGHILQDLQKIDLCTVQREGNTDIYYLNRIKSLRNLLGPWSKYFPIWKNIFLFLSVCMRIIQTNKKSSPQVAAINAHKDLSPWFLKLQAIGIEPPPQQNELEIYWNDIHDWILKTTGELAHGTSRLLTT